MQILSYMAYVEGSTCPARFPWTRTRLARPLELFLQFFEARESRIVVQLRSKLLDELRACSETEKPRLNPASPRGIAAASGCSANHQELIEAQAALQRDLLGVTDEVWAGDEAETLSQEAFIRALYLPQYLQLKALVDVVGRPRGIERMKCCLDWVCAQGPDHPNAPKTIDELRTRQVEGNLQGKGMDWIAAVVSEHEYRNKVTTCLIHKSLSECGDSELMEVVACYPDFTMFRKLNASFCLTRTKTLMNGGDCCDMCYHDERYVPDFVHPPAEVLDAMKTDAASAS